MEVETFECQETITEPIEASEEAIALIEEMELHGQLSLIRSKTEEEPATRCPYRKIRQDERFVYRTLCPATSKLENFSECPIPLRVLQIIAHAKSLGIFKKFEVWSAQGDVKDPVLIAYNTDGYDTSGHTFILARWGDVLEGWPALVQRTLIAWREKCRTEYAKIKAKITQEEAALDEMGMNEALQRETGPSFYGIS